MSFANVMAFALAGIIPPLVLLYFLKLKREERVMSTTMLWHKSIEDLHVNAPFQKLRRNILLLLQLLIMIALILAIARPVMELTGGDVERVAILIDTSASMSAEAPNTRLEQAKKKARTLIDNLRRTDEAMLISFATRARVECSFTSRKGFLRDRLAAIQPTEGGSRLSEAIEIAQAAAKSVSGLTESREAGAPPLKLYCLSDGNCHLSDELQIDIPQVHFLPVGESDRNVGIVAMDVGRQSDGSCQVFGIARNFASEDMTVSVQFLVNDELVDIQRLQLSAGGSRSVIFDTNPLDEATFELMVSVKDDLASDNRAWTILRPERRSNVLLVTDGNHFLEKTLLADEEIVVNVLGTEAYEQGNETVLQAEAIVFDRFTPLELPPVSSLFVGVVPELPGVTAVAEVEYPGILDWKASHPVLRFAGLDTVRIGKAWTLKLPSHADVLVESDNGPIAAAISNNFERYIVCSFDLFDTNWPLRISFPIFVKNAISYLTDARDKDDVHISTSGRPVILPVPRGVEAVSVQGPQYERVNVAVKGQHVTVVNPEKVGMFEATWEGGESRFAVNLFDADESDIKPNVDLNLGEQAVVRMSHIGPNNRDIWRWFAAFAMVVMLIEWYVYNRRVHI